MDVRSWHVDIFEVFVIAAGFNDEDFDIWVFC